MTFRTYPNNVAHNIIIFNSARDTTCYYSLVDAHVEMAISSDTLNKMLHPNDEDRFCEIYTKIRITLIHILLSHVLTMYIHTHQYYNRSQYSNHYIVITHTSSN